MKNSEDKILYLTIESHWLKMIWLGFKREEYREIKPYWVTRLIKGNPQGLLSAYYTDTMNFIQLFKPKHFNKIQFRAGYGKNSPIILIEFQAISIGKGIKNFGAPKYPVFRLRLGEIIETHNIPQGWIDAKEELEKMF